MPSARFGVGESFQLQLAWRLPTGGYLRALLRAQVEDLDHKSERYIVRLAELLAGREETADGRPIVSAERSQDYWDLLRPIIGRRIAVAYEADDGRTLLLRLATLTGEHRFFFRYPD